MTLFSLEKSNLFLLLIFSYFIFLESSSINDIKNGKNFEIETVILLISANCPKLLALIPKKIILHQTKQEIQNKKLKLDYKGYFFYFIMIFMEFLTQVLYIVHKKTIQNTDIPIYLDLCLKGFQIFIVSSLGACFLKYQFLTHKKVGLIILFLGAVLSIFLGCFLSDFTISPIEITAILFQIAVNITAGIHEVFEKYLMEYKYQHVFQILFMQGLVESIILGVSFCYLFFSRNSKGLLDWLWSYLKHFIVYSFCSSGYHFFRIIINWNLSPTHRIMSDSFYAICFFYYYLCIEFSMMNLIISVSYLLSFCGSLVYHEVLIIKMCGVDRDTKKEIQNRAEKDINNCEILIEEEKEFLPKTPISSIY